MTQLIVAFRNFTNAPKNIIYSSSEMSQIVYLETKVAIFVVKIFTQNLKLIL
jgi:hypothetical protein